MFHPHFREKTKQKQTKPKQPLPSSAAAMVVGQCENSFSNPAFPCPPFFPESERESDSIPQLPHHTNTPKKYDLNNKIMLSAIISLSVVVVFVTILHLYARYILRRQARRRAAIRQLAMVISEVRSDPPKTGLDRAVIASLPIFVFKKSDDYSIGNDETGPPECAVCLSILEDDEMARLLPNCKHTFHAECIDKWLSSQSTCPICRTQVEPMLLPATDCEPVIVGASAPPVERVNSTLTSVEETSNGGLQQSSVKASGSNSRLSSFRRMLSRERSSRQIQSCGQEDGVEDLERQ
ncbi:unnamed protein product [Camellia sinensis]